MAYKIVEKVPDEKLQQDLEKYRKQAIELGATDAKVIPADIVVVDERVRAKCIYPKCGNYGTNVNCPPYSIDLSLTREVVKRFQKGIFFMLRDAAETVAGPDVLKTGAHLPSGKKVHEIVGKLESGAFYDGYYLAIGFAAGSCKSLFCPDKECSALTTGQRCRFSYVARTSMEGAGMDAYAMATKVGWDIYPIGRSSLSSDVPHGTRLGLVLIY